MVDCLGVNLDVDNKKLFIYEFQQNTVMRSQSHLHSETLAVVQ